MFNFDKDGYCPIESFIQRETLYPESVSKIWTKVKEILGDRISFMVYSPNGFSVKPLVNEMFMQTENLGLQVAISLSEMIPSCSYPDVGKKILITDVINKCLIPARAKRFEEELYTLGIDEKADSVGVYIYLEPTLQLKE